MIPYNPYTYRDLQELEKNTPLVKSKIKGGKFVFDDSTRDLSYVFLGNIFKSKGNEEKEKVQLSEIVFETRQENLKYLDASNCQIEHITIKNCPNLQSLYLPGNGLQSITFEEDCPNLRLLDVSNNLLTRLELPFTFSSLQYLYLYKNKLNDLSNLAWFFTRKGFDFNIEENETLTAPEKSIVKGGKTAILEWFRQVELYKTEKAYEAKILIVGEPGAGKTTLMKLLFDRKTKVPEPEQTSTLGIEVKENREFDHPEKTLPTIKAHIWDFGGQNIQYMLHQYFLTDDSVYILITDGRSGKTRFGY